MPAVLKYIGPHDEVEIPAAGVVVKQGEAFEAESEVAAALLEQSQNFTAVKQTTKKES